MKSILRFFLLAFLALTAHSLRAATISVPDEAAGIVTISDALSRANNGDRIEIAAGHYGKIYRPNKNSLTLIGIGDVTIEALPRDPNADTFIGIYLLNLHGTVIENLKFISPGPTMDAEGGDVTITSCTLSATLPPAIRNSPALDLIQETVHLNHVLLERGVSPSNSACQTVYGEIGTINCQSSYVYANDCTIIGADGSPDNVNTGDCTGTRGGQASPAASVGDYCTRFTNCTILGGYQNCTPYDSTCRARIGAIRAAGGIAIENCDFGDSPAPTSTGGAIVFIDGVGDPLVDKLLGKTPPAGNYFYDRNSDHIFDMADLMRADSVCKEAK